MSAWKPVAVLLCCFALLIAALLLPVPPPAAAQSGCALRINEIMFYPGAGLFAIDEWVELYVAADIPGDATFFITDYEGATAGDFELAFIVPGGTAQGAYIVIHNDGNPANNPEITTTGIYTTINYYMGNPDVNLRRLGDEIGLYVGSDESGVPCDYVEYLEPNSARPAGFAWDNGACPNPGGAIEVGQSISLNPNGTFSNSACDWVESGQQLPGDPDSSFTGFPDTKGYSNNTTPTAVTLASFTVTQANGGDALFGLFASLLTGGTLWAGVAQWRSKRKQKRPAG